MDDVFRRLMDHFLIAARDALDDDVTVEEIAYEARVLYGQFLGWTPTRNTTIH